MYAVVQTGGKQYRITAGDVIVVERLQGEAGGSIQLPEVLMLDDGNKVTVGKPFVEKAVVTADIIEQSRARKIIVFKRKRRKNYKRTAGHRQHVSVLRVTEIKGEGYSAKAAPAKKETAAEKTDAPAAPAKKKAPAKKPAAAKE